MSSSLCFLTSCGKDEETPVREERVRARDDDEDEDVSSDSTDSEVSSADPDDIFSPDKQRYHETGNEITFGSYQGEDIVWIVLEESEKGTLLLSKYVLEYATFDGDDVMRSWQTTRLRPWLNEDFFNSAFDEEEKEKILWSETEVIDHFTRNGGETEDMYREPTLDKVFLLSTDELAKYYPDKIVTCYCEATEYAVSQGAPRENCSWWLRGPCEIETTDAGTDTGKPVADINTDPISGTKSLAFGDYPYGVRPAMWVDLDGTVTDRTEPSDWIAEVSVETQVTDDGRYAYTLYSGSNYELTLTMDIDINDYISDGHFDLPRLLYENGWEFFDVNGFPIDYPSDEHIAVATHTKNGIETEFDFWASDPQTHQLCAFAIDFKVPRQAGQTIFDTENYYDTMGSDRYGHYEIYEPQVSFDRHEIDCVVDNFGIDGFGDLSKGLSYSDIVVVTYALMFLSEDGNEGRNPFYYTTMEGGESLRYSMVYDLP